MEWLRMTAEEYRKFRTQGKAQQAQASAVLHGKSYNYPTTGIKSPNTNKYNAKKTEIDGVQFDSKKEAQQWLKLKRLASAGIISELQRQVKFVLQEGYRNNQGKAIRPICYIADFVYEQDGQKYVQDSKGVRTEVYKIKRKIFEKRYPEYIFIET